MSARFTPYRSGIQRGLLEVKHDITSFSDMAGFVFPTALALTVILFLRDVDIEGAPVSLGSMSLPSLMGMNIAFGGLMGVIGKLTMERGDGTLLRAKAIPGGMTGYLMGATVSTASLVLLGAVVLLIPGMLLFDGVAFGSPMSWLLLIVVLVLGMAATMPIGAVLGALITNPRMIGLITMPLMGLVAISGIFYPITALPGWVQAISQVFPMYWLGLGMRSALLPDAMAAVEIGDSWRHLETIAVLGVWSVAGILIAPAILRRMARRQSGSAVARHRERAIHNSR